MQNSLEPFYGNVAYYFLLLIVMELIDCNLGIYVCKNYEQYLFHLCYHSLQYCLEIT
jgi:hypothetical protein